MNTPFTITLGFMPLVDAALPILAASTGFAESEGLSIRLVRETSWANIRDRVMLGHFDAAHMLAPLPIAASLGLGHFAVPMAVPAALGLGGNAITLAAGLFKEMQADAGIDLRSPPLEVGRALAAAVARRAAQDAPQLTLAMVHPFSCHNYELRYWLAAAGIDPDHDVRLVVLPPPFMVDALREGHVDGFAVGEPWNTLAVEEGVGVIAAVKAALWRQGPEKVLGLPASFVDEHGEETAALVRAIDKAARFAADPANHRDVAALLARPEHVGAPAEIILRALSGRIVRAAGREADTIPDFLTFHDHAANFPWRSHALWIYSQMVRWHQVEHGPDAQEAVAAVYRPELYREALSGTDADLPLADAKVEGALTGPTLIASTGGRLVLGPDGFFDGHLFDPNDVEGYLQSFKGA